MKKASVRQIQHHLSAVLRQVERGHEILVTKRNRVVAKIVPARQPAHTVSWPDFVQRAGKIWNKAAQGKTVSKIIIESRRERL